MPYLMLGFAALVLFLILSKRFMRADVKKVAKGLRTFGGLLAIIFALIFTLSGRIAFAVPLAAIGFMLLQRAYFPSHNPGNAASGQKSEVRTDFLHMILDHDSGEMSGTILKGRWRGQAVESLTRARMIDFWRECAQSDPRSEQLMAAFLDQAYTDWRDDLRQEEQAGADAAAASAAPLSLDEAYNILGLERGATTDDINRAHRALMKRFHPDHGGSNYLAAKINEAKELLLKSI